ncbi:glycosyltransferase [Aurantibacter sp.]|uniref:glycosyltransferase n=1 Tax=Aurantibacter sp. TaxID=2807103 RepID=UPI0032670C63
MGTGSKKWLFVLPTDSVQGSEHIVKSVATYLYEKQNDCTVIILTRKESLGWASLENKMNVIYLPFNSYVVGVLILPFYLMFNKIHIDYTFSSQTIINGMLGFSKRLGIIESGKVILRESNSIFDLLSGYKLKFYSLFYKLGYKGSSMVICQTRYMKAQLEKSLPKLSQKLNLKTIPNPFNFDDICKKSGELSEELQKKSFIVAAGRLAPAKGFDLLLEAFKLVRIDFPELHLVILGEGADREMLTKKAKDLGMENSVIMPGYVNNVYSYFKEAKACVLSSRIEGFPNVLLQMMSQNNSVVSTLSAGGIDEIPGIYTCAPKDVGGLRNTITKALNADNDKNKILFKQYLEVRTLNSFINQILISI